MAGFNLDKVAKEMDVEVLAEEQARHMGASGQVVDEGVSDMDGMPVLPPSMAEMDKGGMGGFPALPVAPAPVDTLEDKVFKGVLSAGKWTVSFSQVLAQVGKSYSAVDWCNYGSRVLIVSGITSAVGIFFILLGLGSFAWSLLVGGVLSSAVGVLVLMFNSGEAMRIAQQMDACEDAYPSDYIEDDSAFSDEEFIDDDDDVVGDEISFVQEAPAIIGGASAPIIPDVPLSKLMSPADLLSSMSVSNGVITRQYIFDRLLCLLPISSPGYNEFKPLAENNEAFLFCSYACINALRPLLTGKSTDGSEPYLVSVKESLFSILIELFIPLGLKFKPETFETELLPYFMRSPSDDGMTVTVSKWRANYIVKVFKGAPAMVSLGDMLALKKEAMIDPKRIMPLVLGVDSDGETLFVDFRDIESMLVTGMPRSGKSLFVKSILCQLAAFNSPRELIFYILDPKAGLSDFSSLQVPHIQRFVGEKTEIVRELSRIVHVEGSQRKAQISAAGYKNLWDYRKADPDNAPPLLVVIIDEVMTLANDLEKDDKRTFMELLSMLISQLPAAGVRALLVPHLVKDTIISKNVSSLIPCRCSVKGDAAHIKDTLDVTNFPYKLRSPGDIAIKLAGDARYIRGPVVSLNETEVDTVFKFIGDMWLKIDPTLPKGVMCGKVAASGGDSALPTRTVDVPVALTGVPDGFLDIHNSL